MMKQIFYILMFMLVFSACKKDNSVDVQSIKLSETTLVMHKGEQHKLTVTIQPNNATDKNVVWSSSNTTVATVTEGLVQALTAGTVDIKATVNGQSAICQLTVEPDIYVVGEERVNEGLEGPTYATMWLNGVPTRLTDGKNYATAHCIYADGSDLYIGGAEMGENGLEYARIWKNGKLFFEEKNPSVIRAVTVSNSILYTAGFCTTNKDLEKPVIWRNGVIDTLDYAQYEGGEIACMKVIGSDVYTGGWLMLTDELGGIASVPVIWKNGKLQYMYDTPTYLAFLLGIDVSSAGDIYACGTVLDRSIYWKNNERQVLAESGNAFSLFLSGNDVYITGYSGSPVQGTIWKNGKELYTIPGEGNRSCTLGTSALWGNDLYTEGDIILANEYSVINVWKNGKLLKTLTDGTRSASSNAIMLKK